jgi:DNA-binding response OmpR family regulator
MDYMNTSAQILIVDDEEPITALLAEVLIDQGYRVSVAADGLRTLAEIREHPPALVLLDNMLPGICGKDIVRLLRAEGVDRLPIIMMSAASAAEPLLQAGATDFIAKPFDLDAVLACISHYVPLPQPATE